MAVVLNPNDPNATDPNAQTGPNGAPLQTIGTAAPAGQSTPNAGPVRPQPQGSGRFTNLQKYLQANQAGGQRIAQQVGSGLQKQFGKEAEEAQKYYGQLGQSVAQAQQVAQAGAGYQQQLKDIGQQIGSAQQAGYGARDQQSLGGIEQFVQQPGFRQFQDIQAGRGIDENLLALQQQRALAEASQAADISQQASQALGTEGGRFELLRKAFGGDARSGYTQGQQRLDQVLLGQGGGLGGLQAQTATQAKSDLEQARLAAAQRGEVGRLATQERGLMTDIGSQAATNEQAYLDMLESFVPEAQKQREKEYSDLQRKFEAYKKYTTRPATTPLGDGVVQKAVVSQDIRPEDQFSQEELQRLGVTGPSRTYNVFGQLEGVSDIASRGQAAQSGADIAGAQDVSRYQALANILGMNPEARRLTQEGQIGAAWMGKEGEAGLGGRLSAAEKQFQDTLGKEQYRAGWNPTGSQAQMGSGGFQAKRGPLVGARATGTGLLNQGMAGIEMLRSGGYSPYENIRRDEVWNQFADFLRNQGYANTLGGAVADPNKDISKIFNQG